MKNIVLIIAGGVGARMGQDIPKQFINVYDKPVIVYTKAENNFMLSKEDLEFDTAIDTAQEEIRKKNKVSKNNK